MDNRKYHAVCQSDGRYTIQFQHRDTSIYPNEEPVRYPNQASCMEGIHVLEARNQLRQQMGKTVRTFPSQLGKILYDVQGDCYYMHTNRSLTACVLVDCRPRDEQRGGSQPHPFGLISCDPLEAPYVFPPTGKQTPKRYLANPKEIWVDLPRETAQAASQLNSIGLLTPSQLKRFQQMDAIWYQGIRTSSKEADFAFTKYFRQASPCPLGWFAQLDEPSHYTDATKVTAEKMLRDGFSPMDTYLSACHLSPMIFPERDRQSPQDEKMVAHSPIKALKLVIAAGKEQQKSKGRSLVR